MVHFASQNWPLITVVSNWTLCCDLESVTGLWKLSGFCARASLLCILRGLGWPLLAWLEHQEGCKTTYPFFISFTQGRVQVGGSHGWWFQEARDEQCYGFSVVMCLPLRTRVLSLASMFKASKFGWWHMLVTVVLGRQKQNFSWSSLASQTCLIGELEAVVRALVSKNKVDGSEDSTWSWPSYA